MTIVLPIVRWWGRPIASLNTPLPLHTKETILDSVFQEIDHLLWTVSYQHMRGVHSQENWSCLEDSPLKGCDSPLQYSSLAGIIVVLVRSIAYRDIRMVLHLKIYEVVSPQQNKLSASIVL